MVVGHTHRISNLMRGDILITEGSTPARPTRSSSSWSQGGDVQWAGGATRIAKNLGRRARADVQAIVDDANAQTAVLRNQVIGTQATTSSATRPGSSSPRWATWWPTRCGRSTPGSTRR